MFKLIIVIGEASSIKCPLNHEAIGMAKSTVMTVSEIHLLGCSWTISKLIRLRRFTSIWSPKLGGMAISIGQSNLEQIYLFV
jgi:hypothetical protein